jgi:hypothetical protein
VPARRAAFLLALAAGFSFAYFYQAGGWNQNSRFDLVRAITEDGSLAIDRFAGNTGDKARFGGRLYSDKAPGLALAAVPGVALARPLVKLFGTDPAGPRGVGILSYLATLFAVALPLAAATGALSLAARRLGADGAGASFVALVFALGSPMWAYATLLWGHGLASACLVLAYVAALSVGDTASRRRDLLVGLLVGLLGGWAVVTEFPTLPPAALISVLALRQARRGGWPRVLPVAAAVAAGAAICATVLLVYQAAAFGSAFTMGYSHVEGFTGMKQGFLGVTYPKPFVLAEIIGGRFRGLLPLAPVLALGPVGLVLLWRRATWPVAAALSIVVYYLLFNGAYTYWNGGWSYGPRHIAPALPFLALGIVGVWVRVPSWGRALIATAGAWGLAMSLIAVSTTAQPPEFVGRPVGQLLWPAFRDGDLSLNHQSFLEGGADGKNLRGGRIPHDAWNLGELLGLRGHASLVPLLVVWAVLGGGTFWQHRRRRQRSPAGRDLTSGRARGDET